MAVGGHGRRGARTAAGAGVRVRSDAQRTARGRATGRVGRRRATDPASRGLHGRRLLAGPLLLLGIAIATYVASEVGVSNWLVRFLEPAPLTTATLALSLYWAGLTVGRLISSAIADRFDHLRFTLASTLVMAGLLAVAILAPTLPVVDRGVRGGRRRLRVPSSR